jgi:hypothetical protein
MAITAAALQTALGDGNPLKPRVLRAFGTYGTQQHWYVQGGQAYANRTKFVVTTAADDATTQAAAVVTALRAGPV